MLHSGDQCCIASTHWPSSAQWWQRSGLNAPHSRQKRSDWPSAFFSTACSTLWKYAWSPGSREHSHSGIAPGAIRAAFTNEMTASAHTRSYAQSSSIAAVGPTSSADGASSRPSGAPRPAAGSSTSASTHAYDAIERKHSRNGGM